MSLGQVATRLAYAGCGLHSHTPASLFHFFIPCFHLSPHHRAETETTEMTETAGQIETYGLDVSEEALGDHASFGNAPQGVYMRVQISKTAWI